MQCLLKAIASFFYFLSLFAFSSLLYWSDVLLPKLIPEVIDQPFKKISLINVEIGNTLYSKYLVNLSPYNVCKSFRGRTSMWSSKYLISPWESTGLKKPVQDPADLMLGNSHSKAEQLPFYLEFNILKLHVLNTNYRTLY